VENKAYTFIAGLFALLLTGAILAAFWWLGGTHTPQTMYKIASPFSVSGLNPQAAVRFRGVTVGRVEDIQFDPANPRNIIIDISVDERLQLTRGSFAQLAQQGVTGLAYIEIDDSGEDLVTLGKEMIPLRESALSELMASGKAIIAKTEKLEDSASTLLTTLNQLLNQENTQKINSLLTNMEHSSALLEPLLRSSQHTSERAGKLMDSIKPQELSATLDAVRQASMSAKDSADSAKPTLIQAQKSLAEFERLSRHIEQMSGELGDSLNDETLPRIHQLTEQLTRDAQSLNKLMESLEQNPQSAIFGKPQPQPGPGEKGFQP
jgi:phospholipid/cholesterol/gamma-HCH transport system substrate-binding protein